jgi:hypothetical protein
MTTLAKAYSAVIKYGRASEEGIQQWVNIASEYHKNFQTNNNIEDGSHPDHSFADWLQDQGDPRHLILNKDLEVRKLPGKYFYGDKLDPHCQAVLGPHDKYGFFTRSVPGENMEVRKRQGTKGIGYEVTWFPTPTAGAFTGLLSPEELTELFQQLDIKTPLKYFD